MKVVLAGLRRMIFHSPKQVRLSPISSHHVGHDSFGLNDLFTGVGVLRPLANKDIYITIHNSSEIIAKK